MTQHVKAIYDQGVLRPLEPLDLQDQAVVSLAIDAPNSAAAASQDQGQVRREGSLFDLLDEAGLIGCVRGAPADLSANPRHMEGFGGRAP